jgi:hypothetical protein
MGRKECGTLRSIVDRSYSSIPKYKALQGPRYHSNPSRPIPDKVQQLSNKVVGSMDSFGSETHDASSKVCGIG